MARTSIAGPGETRRRRNNSTNRVWNQLNTDIFCLLGTPQTPKYKNSTIPVPGRYEIASPAVALNTHCQNPSFHARVHHAEFENLFSLVGRRTCPSYAETEDSFPIGKFIVDRGISPFSLWNRNFVDRGLLSEEG